MTSFQELLNSTCTASPLSKNNEVNIKLNMMVPNRVFVTYAWGDADHEEKVVAFTEWLRKKHRYNAVLDKSIVQDHSATDFLRMMLSNIESSDRVIIVLSKDYKEKADNDLRGVGVEFHYILKHLKDNPKKFIFIAFQKIEDSIIPKAVREVDVLDITKDDEKERLFEKLLDSYSLNFSPVLEDPIPVAQKVIKDFDLLLNSKTEYKQRIQSTGIAPLMDIDNLMGSSKLSKYYRWQCIIKAKQPAEHQSDLIDFVMHKINGARRLLYFPVINPAYSIGSTPIEAKYISNGEEFKNIINFDKRVSMSLRRNLIQLELISFGDSFWSRNLQAEMLSTIASIMLFYALSTAGQEVQVTWSIDANTSIYLSAKDSLITSDIFDGGFELYNQQLFLNHAVTDLSKSIVSLIQSIIGYFVAISKFQQHQYPKVDAKLVQEYINIVAKDFGLQ